MSSLSSSVSSTSSTPPTSTTTFSTPGPPASSESLGAPNAGPSFDKRPERRRSTLSGPDRKRRLINPEEYAFSSHAGPRTTMEAGSSSRTAMDSRSIPMLAPDTRPDFTAAGSSYATPIDLSSSPPEQSRQPVDHRGFWPQAGNNYLEYTLPRWQPDSGVTNCPICGTAFSFWYRKHHCRKCGRVVCASCSPHRITIPRQFIVRPPDPNHSPASITIPPHAAQVVDLEGDDSSQLPTVINPALGGGEEVRLCNPCVPDPNPEPPRGYATIQANGATGLGWMQGAYIVPNQPRHRSYHSVSTPIRPHPHDIFAEPSTRVGRRTGGSNDYSAFGGGLGGVFSSSVQERPMRYGSLSTSHYATSPVDSSNIRSFLGYPSSNRPLPSLTAEGGGMSPAISFGRTGVDQESRRRVSRPSRRHIAEGDICPICNDQLPLVGQNGNEDAREAHIRDCIESHGHRARSGSPMASPPLPVRMLAYTATEKDCLGQDGVAQECTICMEEYEVGQSLVRLECLCKFHKRCIAEWFERKQECPVHKVS